MAQNDNSVQVVVWSLTPGSASPAQDHFSIGPVADGIETALMDDRRKLVNPSDIQPGGKYYSIVKLQMRYEKQQPDDSRWALGTGWLIRPDLLVTAGHCVFDHQYSLGRVVEVKAYLGYNGKASIGRSGVQFRHGKRVATNSNWVAAETNRANDVGFIELDNPFDNVMPFKFGATPTKGQGVNIGIVGYPSDKSLQDESGAQMYEMFASTTWDLRTAGSNLLEHKISTYSGQSGAPVIVGNANELTSYGACVYGLGERNLASVVKGDFGNDYNAYVSAFSRSSLEASSGISSVSILSGSRSATRDENPEEDFWSILARIAKLERPVELGVLQTGNPFIGPHSTKAAAVVGSAISLAQELLAQKSSSFIEPGSNKNRIFESVSGREHASRAILAEAALAALLRMDTKKMKPYFEDIKKAYDERKSTVVPLADLLGSPLLDPVLRLIVYDTSKPRDHLDNMIEKLPKPTATDPSRFSDPLQRNLYVRLADSARQTGAEDSLEDILRHLNPNKPTRSKMQMRSLFRQRSDMSGISDTTATGSSMKNFSRSGADSESIESHMQIVFHRALLAEAILEAIQKAPADAPLEDFFGAMMQTIQKIGVQVGRLAPVIQRVTTAAIDQLFPDGVTSEPLLPSDGVQKPPNSRKSLADALADGDLN